MTTPLRSLAYSVTPGSPLVLTFSHGGKLYRMPIRVRASALTLLAPADPSDPNGLPNVQAKIDMDAPVEAMPPTRALPRGVKETEAGARDLWRALFEVNEIAWIEDPIERTAYLLNEIARFAAEAEAMMAHEETLRSHPARQGS
jgi:hypothetical protein